MIRDPFHFNVEAYSDPGFRGFVVAASGRGKSHLAGVICEQAIDAGMPTIIIDPEGEYHTLGERFPVIIAGGDHAMIGIPQAPGAMAAVLGFAIEARCPLVFDLSIMGQDAQRAAWQTIADGVFALKHSPGPTVLLVVEEAQIFAPQKYAGPSNDAAETLVRRGRKRGIWTLWLTQRSADISKALISQCNVLMAGGLEIEHDFEAIKSRVSLTFDELRALERGLFFVSPPGRVMRIPARVVTHAGASPGLGLDEPQSKAQVLAVVEKMRAALTAAEAPEVAEGDASATRRLRSDYEHLRSQHGQASQQWSVERGELVSKARRLTQELETVRAAATDAMAFTEAARKVLGPAPGQPADIDAVVAKVLAAIGPISGNHVLTVAPVEVLRSEFARAEVERICAAVRGLDPQAATLLLWLVQYDKAIGVSDLLKRALGHTGKGQGFIEGNRRLKELHAAGLAENVARQGWTATVRERIAGDLEAYGAAEEEKERVYQAVLATVVTARGNGA